MLQVDGEQDNHRAAEHQPRDQERLPAQLPVLEHEQDGGDNLDRRIDQRDRSTARPASSAERDETQQRNILEPPEGPSTGRTVRGRTDDRSTVRQPVDAHIEEAPDRQTEQSEQNDVDRISHRGVVPGGSSGSGNSGDFGEMVTAPARRSSRYG